jgi:hypothetical protein
MKQIPKPRQKKTAAKEPSSYKKVDQSDDTSSSNDDTSLEGTQSEEENNTSNFQRHRKHSKLIPFGDKETWKVWYNRFKVCTNTWSKKEKLEEILPLLRGTAADFVFDQLPARKLNNFSSLIKELDNRFKKVENPRTYRAKLSKLRQRGETVEEYAAEIKRVYDKAYPERDITTREEDLLQKFLEGLKDQHAASQVQFIRKLEDIDEAVDAIVNFQELHGKAEKSARSRLHRDSSSDDSDSEVRWLPHHKSGRKEEKGRFIPVKKESSRNESGDTRTECQESRKQAPIPPSDIDEEAYDRRNFQINRISTWDQQNFGDPAQQVASNKPSVWGQATQPRSLEFRKYVCFKCGGPNHIARNCQASPVRMQPFGGIQHPKMPYFQSIVIPADQNLSSTRVPSGFTPGYVYPPAMRTGNP